MWVSTGSLDHGHMFAVHRLQEIGRKASVSLFKYFIDLRESLRHRRPHPPVAGPHSYRCPAAATDDSSHPTNPRWDESLWDLMTASVRIGSRWGKDYGKDACYPHCCLTSSQPCWLLYKDSARIRLSLPSWYTWKNRRYWLDRSRLWTTFVVRCGVCCSRMTPA